MDRRQLGLYLVTDSGLAEGRSLEEIVLEAVRGGVTMVQLREKHLDTRAFIEMAIRLKKALAPFGVPLIINDRVDVALACDADGVHIGQSDMPYETARALLGPGKIIGLSVENMAQVREANALDVDYIGVSPVFATSTKTDTARPFGIEGLRSAAEISRHPIVAIGGINAATAPAVLAAGADGLAVVSAIVCARSPRAAAQQLAALLPSSPMHTLNYQPAEGR
ncbi:MAG: thiamine phosphate synthase [Bacteroidales bacterium]|nr:thiamine phosphate synthase [Candidatus Cryptobacteroides aphodequi]